VPAWIPGHLAWALATGTGFLAAAAAILTSIRARLAALMASGMMAAFTILIWLVDVARAPGDRFHWTGLAVSSTLAAAAWVVAETYRDAEKPEFAETMARAEVAPPADAASTR
jgi:hypothetical protein